MVTAPEKAPTSGASEEHRLETAELEIGGMHCSACATRVQRSLNRLPAVASASVNLATTRAFVSYDSAALTTDALCRAVEDTGYTASPVTAAAPRRESDRAIGWGLRAGISWPLAIAALVVALSASESAVAGWVVLGLAVAVEVIGGGPFVVNAARLLSAPRDQHGHAHRARHPLRARSQRGGGGRARRAPRPPRRRRRGGGQAARRDGAAHRRDTRDGPGYRGAGTSEGRAGHALAARAAAAGRPGHLRRGRRG